LAVRSLALARAHPRKDRRPVTTYVAKQRVITGLADVWSRLDDLLADIDEADWHRPTHLAGWDVQDNVAHVIGTERMLLGESPGVEIDRADHPYVRNDIGAFNEQWVQSMRSAAPADVLKRLRDVTSRRMVALQAIDDEAWNAEGFTPAGRDTYGRFMRIRTFDCWLHEQDIRDALERPGGEAGPAAALALEEMTTAMGYVVGKRAGAPAGSRVRFELTGASARRIDVEVGERARVVDDLTGEPTVTLTMPAGVFARLGGGRVEPASVRAEVSIDGDVELGERVLANLAFTI
jgi:uncharacterized protein (TIGR03083 family)